MNDIRAAHPDEGPVVGDIIARSFHDLEISQWLVPDAQQRHPILRDHFTLFTTHAITHGIVTITTDHTAAAVWLPSAGVPDIPDFTARNKAICGEHTDKFDALGECFDTNHPHGPAHHYLQFLGVVPQAQRQGLGGLLLQAHHDHLGPQHTPTYLEAASLTSRRLYLRHGYHDHAEPIRPRHDSPLMYPMWREADSPTTDAVPGS